MIPYLMLASLAVAAFVPQRGGSGSGAPPLDPTPPSAFEQFVDRLKLDRKSQLPAVEQIFTQAATDAAPVAQDLARLRQSMLDAELNGKPDEVKAAQEAYTVAAAKMAGFEAQAFAKVHALLKPNQKSKATEAFALMGGLFQLVSAPGGGRRRGGDR